MKYVPAVLAYLCAGLGTAADRSLLPERVNYSIQQRLADGDFPALVIAVVDSDRAAIYSLPARRRNSWPRGCE